MTSEHRNVSTLLGVMIILAGIALLVMSLALTKETGGKGMDIEPFVYYAVENVVMGIFGGMLISGGASYLVLSRSGTSEMARTAIATEKKTSHGDHQTSAPDFDEENLGPKRSDLVLRLLEGDERAMYRTILDEGGEVLQKDLMEKTKMSNAKVTRVLDRLEDKELIVRERYGMTNRVRLERSN